MNLPKEDGTGGAEGAMLVKLNGLFWVNELPLVIPPAMLVLMPFVPVPKIPELEEGFSGDCSGEAILMSSLNLVPDNCGALVGVVELSSLNVYRGSCAGVAGGNEALILVTGAVDPAAKFNGALLVGKEAAIVTGAEVTDVEVAGAEVSGAELKLNILGAVVDSTEVVVVAENRLVGAASSVGFVVTPNTNGAFLSKLPFGIVDVCAPNVRTGAGGGLTSVLEGGFPKIVEVGAVEDVVKSPTVGAVEVAVVTGGADSPPKMLPVGREANKFARSMVGFEKLMRGAGSGCAVKVLETEAAFSDLPKMGPTGALATGFGSWLLAGAFGAVLANKLVWLLAGAFGAALANKLVWLLAGAFGAALANKLVWDGAVSVPNLNIVGGCIPLAGTAGNAVNAEGTEGFGSILDTAVSLGSSF